MSNPKFLQNPTLRLLHINGVERIGDQHYLIWRNGAPLTEVQCIPTGSRRWYCRGSGLRWYSTRQAAIAGGIKYAEAGQSISRNPLPPWSLAADASIKSTKGKE